MAKASAKVIRFEDAFVHAVEFSFINHVISRGRKFKRGDRLYLFPKGRGQRRLRSTHCEEVKDVHIASNGVVIIDNHVLCEAEKQQLSVNNGFKNFQHFMLFSKQGRLPLKGQLVRWM